MNYQLYWSCETEYLCIYNQYLLFCTSTFFMPRPWFSQSQTMRPESNFLEIKIQNINPCAESWVKPRTINCTEVVRRLSLHWELVFAHSDLNFVRQDHDSLSLRQWGWRATFAMSKWTILILVWKAESNHELSTVLKLWDRISLHL